MHPRKFLLVDLGGTRVRVAVATQSGLVERHEERTELAGGPEGTEWQIEAMVRRVARDSGTEMGAIERLVIAAPGPLDPVEGVVREAPNMTGWHEVHIVEDLSRLLELPVHALNDANAAGLGEFAFGAARGLRHMVYITISTGIGGGVVVDGKLLEGTSGTGGELGHMTIDRHGPVCKCGNIGCLEILASGTSIARRFRELLEQGRSSTLAARVRDRDVTAADISDAARNGDPLAVELFRDVAEAVGTGVVNAVHIFNPELVVLGGGVTRAGDLLFEPVKEMMSRYAMEMPRRAVRIAPAELGDNAGLYGALAHALSVSARLNVE